LVIGNDGEINVNDNEKEIDILENYKELKEEIVNENTDNG
jgi:hypothetical protein